jgi:hypothetical protein
MPLGLAPWNNMISASIAYPNPTTFPYVWIWTTPTIGLTTSGSNVTAWNDLSGNGHNFTAFSSSPHVTTGVTINGAPALDFSGVNAFATTTASFQDSNLQYFTCFSVVEPQGTIGDYVCVFNGTNFEDGFYLGTNVNGTEWKLILAQGISPTPPYGTCNGGTPTSGTPVLLTVICNNGACTLQVNGTTVATETFSLSFLGGGDCFPVLGNSQSGNNGLIGYYGDQCLCVGNGDNNPQPSAAMSGTQLANANLYFMNKYGLI